MHGLPEALPTGSMLKIRSLTYPGVAKFDETQFFNAISSSSIACVNSALLANGARSDILALFARSASVSVLL